MKKNKSKVCEIKNTISNLLTSDGSVTISDYLSGGCYGYDVDVKDKNYESYLILRSFLWIK